MNLSEIKALIAAMADSGLAEMTYSENGWTLHLVRDAAPPAANSQRRVSSVETPTTVPEAPAPSLDIEAPLAGIVHLRPTPEAPPFLEVGQAVRAGDALCIIEAMKVFNTIRAERDGVIAAVLVSSGVEVEAGQPLFRFA
jgi:acetyl-CoA carboxylase biotin carboxyl carrier protein